MQVPAARTGHRVQSPLTPARVAQSRPFMNETAKTQETCYHCGLPIPPESHYWVTIDGTPRRMCCAGCEAVANAIVAAGLTNYYRHRDAMPEPVREALPDVLKTLETFDAPELVEQLSRPASPHEREVSLILEGITCAACVWLNEQHLRRQKGVTHVEINYATRRALVRWNPDETSLSRILQAVAEIGYRAYPFDPQTSEAVAQRERRAMLWRVFVAGFASMQVMMYLVPTYLAGDGEMDPSYRQLFYWASFLLTLPVMFYSCGPFYRNAWRDLKQRRIGMDVPVALGLLIAFGASVFGMLTGYADVYFDSVSMFAFFLLTGRYFEMAARQRAVRGLDELARALPAVAERWNTDTQTFEVVPAVRLTAGDRIRVKPGEVFPADGVMVEGESDAIEAILTGESRPVPKRVGDEVIGGSVNGSGVVVVEVTHVGEASRLASIRRLVERAQSERPRIASEADRLAGRFVGTVLALAVATALFWAWWAPEKIVPTVVAVLIVACPCALALATPAAVTAATDALLRRGVLVTRGHVLETAARMTDCIFDKTGTLTEGEPALRSVRLLDPARCDETQALALAVALEAGSNHPIARALRRAVPADVETEQRHAVVALRHETGGGLSASIGGRQVALGRPAWVEGTLGIAPLSSYAQEWADGQTSETVVALADEAGWLALFFLEDRLRPEAPQVISRFVQAGVTPHLYSGDRAPAVAAVAQAVGIADAEGDLLPETKHERLLALRAQGAVVGMVGDGVNDAPVLAAADVGIAMGSGADLTRHHADVILVRDSLWGVWLLYRQAKRTLAIIRQNLRWSFGYNLVAIPLAMAGWVTPWLAGIGMAVSSLLVVLNALRLQRLPVDPEQGV